MSIPTISQLTGIPNPGTTSRPVSAPAAASAPSNNGVYWVGADGNVYVKGGSGTNAAGRADANTGSYWGGRGFSQIADPNAPQGGGTPPPNPNGTGGGGSSYTDKSNDISLQQAGLGSVGSQTATGLAAVDKALQNITGQYDTETKANETTYSTQSDTNQNNLQKGKQSSLIGAAQGRQGLFGKLSSIGALSGDGIKLANKAVQDGANEDLSGAADTYGTNQSALDTSIGAYRREDQTRRDQAKTAAEDAKTGINNQGAKSRQTFYSNLANDYAAQGDMANAKKYTSLAAAEYPNVAATSVPSTNLGYTGAAFAPTNLSNYIAGANSTQVSTSSRPDTFGIPGLIASPAKRKSA